MHSNLVHKSICQAHLGKNVGTLENEYCTSSQTVYHFPWQQEYRGVLSCVRVRWAWISLFVKSLHCVTKTASWGRTHHFAWESIQGNSKFVDRAKWPQQLRTEWECRSLWAWGSQRKWTKRRQFVAMNGWIQYFSAAHSKMRKGVTEKLRRSSWCSCRLYSAVSREERRWSDVNLWFHGQPLVRCLPQGMWLGRQLLERPLGRVFHGSQLSQTIDSSEIGWCIQHRRIEALRESQFPCFLSIVR